MSMPLHRATAYQLLLKMGLPIGENKTARLPRAEQQAYLDQHFDRFWYTAKLAERYLSSHTHPKIMEVGGFPFYLSVLVAQLTGGEITSVDVPLADYQAPSERKRVEQQFTMRLGEHELTIRQITANIEHETLAIKNTMDVVIFTEVLEHLTLAPHVAIENIHRALKPNGILVLTTPNAHYLMKVLAFLSGKNLYEPYQLRWGIYGRHNREYLLWEVQKLLTDHHFTILEARSKNFAKGHLTGVHKLKYNFIDTLTSLPPWRGNQEVLVLVAQKYGETVRVQSDFLFRN